MNPKATSKITVINNKLTKDKTIINNISFSQKAEILS